MSVEYRRQKFYRMGWKRESENEKAKTGFKLLQQVLNGIREWNRSLKGTQGVKEKLCVIVFGCFGDGITDDSDLVEGVECADAEVTISAWAFFTA